MLLGVFTVGIVMLCVGFFAYLRGLRGPVVPGVLECRACAFEARPGAATCPECGKSLQSPRATRPRRVRRRGWVYAGHACVLLGLLAAAAVLASRASAKRLIPYAPAWLLHQQVMQGEDELAAAAFAELDTRAASGSVSTAKMQALMDDLTNVLQKSPERWKPAWTQAYCDGYGDGLVTELQWLLMVDLVSIITVEPPKKVHAGKPCWVMLKREMNTALLPAGFTTSHTFMLEKVRIVIHKESPLHAGHGSFGAMFGAGRSTATSQAVVPEGTPLGPAQGKVTYTLAAGINRPGIQKEIPFTVNVVPHTEPRVEMLKEPALAPQMKDAVSLRPVRVSPNNVSVDLDIKQLPRALAVQVFIRPAGDLAAKPTLLGIATLDQGTTSSHSFGWGHSVHVSDAIDVILHPSDEAALQNPTIQTPWLGPDLIYENVQVKRTP